MIFFDSWGCPWEVVPAACPGARAFGPCGTAREAIGAPRQPDVPAAGLIEKNGWTFLLDACADGGFCAHPNGREDCEGIWPDHQCPHRVGGEP